MVSLAWSGLKMPTFMPDWAVIKYQLHGKYLIIVVVYIITKFNCLSQVLMYSICFDSSKHILVTFLVSYQKCINNLDVNVLNRNFVIISKFQEICKSFKVFIKKSFFILNLKKSSTYSVSVQVYLHILVVCFLFKYQRPR